MDKKVRMFISAEQRQLVLQYEPVLFDDELLKCISTAIKKGVNYEIDLDEVQLEELIEQISGLSNHEEDERLQSRLDDLATFLEGFLYGNDQD